MDFSGLGIQTGPLAVLLAIFVLKIFQLFNFHTGEPILITPEGQFWEKGIHPTLELDETHRFQTEIISVLWANFVLKIFQLFIFHTGEPILITPEGQ